MFVTILVHNNPVNPDALELWDTFKEQMSEDYQHEPDDTRFHKALGVFLNFNLVI